VDFLSAFLGEVFSILAFMMIAAGVYKLFQVSSDLRDIKGLLGEIKRNTYSLAPATQDAGPSGKMTPEELVRAVHAGSYDDSVPLEPTVVPPKA